MQMLIHTYMLIIDNIEITEVKTMALYMCLNMYRAFQVKGCYNIIKHCINIEMKNKITIIVVLRVMLGCDLHPCLDIFPCFLHST